MAVAVELWATEAEELELPATEALVLSVLLPIPVPVPVPVAVLGVELTTVEFTAAAEEGDVLVALMANEDAPVATDELTVELALVGAAGDIAVEFVDKVRVATVVLTNVVDELAVGTAAAVPFAIVEAPVPELLDSEAVETLAVTVAETVATVLVAFATVTVAFEAVVVAEAIIEVLLAAMVELEAIDEEATWPCKYTDMYEFPPPQVSGAEPAQIELQVASPRSVGGSPDRHVQVLAFMVP